MLIERETLMTAQTTGYNLYVGQGLPHSTESLAADSGVPERNVRGYKAGESLMSWRYGLSILAAMPREFAMTVLAPTGLIVQPAEDEMATLPELAVVWSASLHAHSVNMLDGTYTESELRSIYPLVKQANMESSRCLRFLHNALGLSQC